jgi:hypothetical protein
MFGNTILTTVVTAYGPYLSLGLICFIVLCILSIFIISIITKTPFGFGVGFFKINFGNKNVVNKEFLISSLLEYQEEHIKKITSIENLSLKRQLNFAEQKLSQLKYLLTDGYSNILSTKLKETDDVKLHKDYRSYQILIGMLIKDLLDKVLCDAFVENHLDDFDDIGWAAYVDDKTNYILNYNADFLDNLYGDGRLVTRKEAYEEENKHFQKNKDVLRSILEMAKSISIQTKVDIRNENDRSQKEIRQLCKSNGVELQ